MAFPTKIQLINRKNSEELLMHLMSHAVCTDRHTVTGLITTAGHQNEDWSKRYRLYSSHIENKHLFDPIIKGVLNCHFFDQPFVVAVDDSTMKKTIIREKTSYPGRVKKRQKHTLG